jgi:hypothetical protein
MLINRDDGEIVSTLDSLVRVNKNPSLAKKGHEEDLVVIKLLEGSGSD